jgi:hypothetical protein
MNKTFIIAIVFSIIASNSFALAPGNAQECLVKRSLSKSP